MVGRVKLSTRQVCEVENDVLNNGPVIVGFAKIVAEGDDEKGCKGFSKKSEEVGCMGQASGRLAHLDCFSRGLFVGPS